MSKNIFKKLIPETLRSKASTAVIVTTAVLVELTAAIQYYYSRNYIRDAVQRRAEMELQIKNLEIQKIMSMVETAAENTAWVIEQELHQPDSLYSVITQLVSNNKNIVGAGIGFEANYYPSKGRWFEPYVAQRKGNETESLQLGNPSHDYLSKTWYHEGKKANSGHWSEPYYDEAGARMMLCTYTLPIRNSKGDIVALLGTDVSLDWLSSVLNAQHIYPSSYNVMISRTGQLMAYPVESLVMRKTIQEVTNRRNDTTAFALNRRMMEGQSGHTTIKDVEGKKSYVFYAPVTGKTGWSMAVVCADHEVYGDLRRVSFNLLLLMLVGLTLLGYIIYRTIKSAHRLEITRMQKNSLDKELRIASNIQKALLPKVFPPYPDRHDVDVHALLNPAKQVGGDLYDFYIRDEKLFFCIGDVSGKGIPASLVMAVTRTMFRNITAHESQPHRILSAINNTLAEDNPLNLFVTFFIGVLDLPTGRLLYGNAGHESPIIINTNKEKLPCDSNIPLGTVMNWNYSQQEIQISSPTTIFLYTDGLTEAEDTNHELFGKERMLENINAKDPQELINDMAAAVHLFVDGAEQSDDLTLLAIRYTNDEYEANYQHILTIRNDVQEVKRLAAFINDICSTANLDGKITMQINLAVEEAVVNIINYAYPKETQGLITIQAQKSEESILFTITDNGSPFDPTAVEDADTTLTIEERPIGGLGILLVRKMMDTINYNRINGKNILTLTKRLSFININD